ncbi:MAG TPA: hypothetical protein VNZ85_16245, partial [Caulobacter sp.]|nr:hypothetical protein [Caulobacter sp.]
MKFKSVALAALLLLAGCATQRGPDMAGGAGGGLECQGRRSARPTVILEAGAFGGAADWSLVAR